MKKVAVTIVLVVSMLFTVGFCCDDTIINPPKGIAPIDYTIIHKWCRSENR